MTSDKNKAFTTKMKHVAARWFYVSDKAQDKTVILKSIDTDHQLADIFTKTTIPREQYEYLSAHMVTVKPKVQERIRKYVKHKGL